MLGEAVPPSKELDAAKTHTMNEESLGDGNASSSRNAVVKPHASPSYDTTSGNLERVKDAESGVDSESLPQGKGDGMMQTPESLEQISLNVSTKIERIPCFKQPEEATSENADREPGMHLSTLSRPAVEQSKFTLNRLPSPFPSPYSPVESLRPLTPPFPDVSEPNSPQSIRLSPHVESESDGTFRSTTRGLPPNSSTESNRHSTVPSCTADGADEHLPAVPFPELRRYTLIDLPVGSGFGSRTLSDIGPSGTDVPLRRKEPREMGGSTNAQSLPNSRTASCPSSVRYSTFEEMGVQSFAMTKGGKTVETTTKGMDGSIKGKRKEARKSKSTSVLTETGINTFSADSRDSFRNGVSSDLVASEPQSTNELVEKQMISRRNRRGKVTDCIIM